MIFDNVELQEQHKSSQLANASLIAQSSLWLQHDSLPTQQCLQQQFPAIPKANQEHHLESRLARF